MSGEVLGAAGSVDPDDLAITICAALRAAGRRPIVVFRIEEGRAVAIEVRAPIGVLVASFPMHPIAMGEVQDGALAKAIEAASEGRS